MVLFRSLAKNSAPLCKVNSLVPDFPTFVPKAAAMLNVHTFTFNAFQENTYVMYTDLGQAAIVDPGCSNTAEEEELYSFIAAKKLKIEAILCTHCHIDHVFGLGYVARKYSLKPLIPEGEMPVLNAVERVASMYGLSYAGSPEVDFFQESIFTLGVEQLQILKVPGHSPDHIALYHKDSAQVISGDVLFYRSIGRTDLPGGDHKTLIDSIRTQLLVLPEDTVVYPGHMQRTTVGDEKRLNPFLT